MIFCLKYFIALPVKVISISVTAFELFNVEPFISNAPVTVRVNPLKLIALPRAVVNAVKVTLFAKTGWFAVLGIVTELEEIGTVAGVQFAGVFQSVPALPSQVWAFKKINGLSRKIKSVNFFFMLYN